MIKDYHDESLSIEDRIELLIHEMTPAQKVSQLVNDAAEIPALGVRKYDWWNEALHGVARAGYATVFPQSVGLAATFDPALLYQIASAIAAEARAKYNDAVSRGCFERYYGLTFWSPNINIFRDPRWGRGHETYGEDPFLTTMLGIAFIKGLQQPGSKHLMAAACAKHFAAHSGPETGRHGFNATVSEKDLRETYLPAFERCVVDGGVEAVMGAYNAVNSEPACANKRLLTDILRGEWGFKGHVVSDCGAIDDIHKNHRLTADAAESAAWALKSGCDLNCGKTYESLVEAYERDLITEEDLDVALRRTLGTRFRLGMFDSQTEYDVIPISENASPAHSSLSLEASCRSLVLLKNNGVLPLDASKGKKIAVIGPNADNAQVLLGNYNGTPVSYVTPLEGIRTRFGNENVVYEKGCELILPDDGEGIARAATAAAGCDITVVCLGLDPTIEGEEGDANNPFAGADRAAIELLPRQQALLESVCEASANVVVLLMSGGCVAVPFAQTHAAAVVQCFYPGESGGAAIAGLLAGDFSPSARLPYTVYNKIEDIPDYRNYAMEGRTYRYFRGKPLYPFGFGLGYTDFEYSKPFCEKSGDGFNVGALIKNIGKREGRETVQVYAEYSDSRTATPVRQLCGVDSVVLKPGEAVRVNIVINSYWFGAVLSDGKRTQPDGSLRFFVGGSQPDKVSHMLGAAECVTVEA